MSTAACSAGQSLKELIAPDLWRRMTHRLVKLNGYTQEKAEETMELTLSYLIRTGAKPGPGNPPSRQEDMGWHNFLMFTRDYIEFCRTHCNGRILCHNPADHNADGECDQDDVDAAG